MNCAMQVNLKHHIGDELLELGHEPEELGASETSPGCDAQALAASKPAQPAAARSYHSSMEPRQQLGAHGD